MPDSHLVVVDPGHFHATLVQQEMYPGLSPLVRVLAPLGPDLIDYLSRIARYNRRTEAPTEWRLDVHAGPDFLDRLRDEPPGGFAACTRRFLSHVADPASLPARERPNLLAKYRLTIGAVALSRS